MGEEGHGEGERLCKTTVCGEKSYHLKSVYGL